VLRRDGGEASRLLFTSDMNVRVAAVALVAFLPIAIAAASVASHIPASVDAPRPFAERLLLGGGESTCGFCHAPSPGSGDVRARVVR